MNNVLILLLLQIVLGAFDTLFHHEWRERLPAKRAARAENGLHAAREFLYAALFLGLAWRAWHGVLAWVVAVVLIAEIMLTIADFVVEDATRRLPRTERVLHTVLAVNFGVLLACFVPVLRAWLAEPTALVAVDHGWISWLLTACALGVLLWGARDALATWRGYRTPRWKYTGLRPAAAPSGRSILVTGATGFIGRRLVRRLIGRGDDVVVLTRERGKAADLFGPFVDIYTDLEHVGTARRIDATVNLAGAPIAALPWTRRRRRALLESRLDVTRAVLDLIDWLQRKPETWINASAVGFYGVRRDDAPLHEKTTASRRAAAARRSGYELRIPCRIVLSGAATTGTIAYGEPPVKTSILPGPPSSAVRAHRRGSWLVTAVVVFVASLASSSPTSAQWIGYPTAAVPRLADGSVDMNAPAPRMPDGRPDLSGIWISDVTPEGEKTPSDGFNLPSSPEMRDMGADLADGLPYRDWLVPIVEERTANLAIDDPHIRCLPDHFLRAYGLPHMLKFVHTRDLLVVLNEMNAGYRQVFLDARPLPEDPTPSWQGYSSGRWSGDTLVVDTIGIRDDTWIDWNGSVITEAARVREEIRRPDFGHLEIRVTVDDPRAYTEPWTVTLNQRIVIDAELIDEICLENEQFVERMGLPD